MFCTTSLCSPSRASILSGLYAHAHGVQNNFTEYPTNFVSFPMQLHQQGYDTACIGKWHLGYPEKFWPNQHGFDEYFGLLGGSVDYFTHKEPNGDSPPLP